MQPFLQALASFWGMIWTMIVGANPNAVIAVLTGVIAGTTITYAWVTWRLLHQSRWAFLVQTIIRITQSTEDLEQRYLNEMMLETSNIVGKIEGKIGQKIRFHWETLRTKMETEPYHAGLFKAIEVVDKKLVIDLHKALLDYIKEANTVRKDIKSELVNFKDELLKILAEDAKKRSKSEGI